VLEYYCIVQSLFPFITLLFTIVTDIPIFGIRTQLHSLWFALLSFIIFLQVMIPRLRAASPNDRPTDTMYRLT
jgi:hypothetical protein